MSVIYENSNYGVQGYNEIERASQLMGVCFASVHRIDFDIPGWDEENYDNILDDVGNIAQAMGLSFSHLHFFQECATKFSFCVFGSFSVDTNTFHAAESLRFSLQL